MKDQKTNRRDFLRKGVLAVTGITAAPLSSNAMSNVETVKMLTPDGKLVEVSKDVVERASKKKVTSKDILNWRTTGIKGF